MNKLTDPEKAALRKLLDRPLFRRAIGIVCAELWTANRNQPDVQKAGLAWAYADGVCSAFDALHQLGEIKTRHAPTSRQLRPESPIN